MCQGLIWKKKKRAWNSHSCFLKVCCMLLRKWSVAPKLYILGYDDVKQHTQPLMKLKNWKKFVSDLPKMVNRMAVF